MKKRRFRVNVLRDSVLAEHAFRAMGYRGTDGAIVWKAACWVNADEISEGNFANAFHGVQVIRPAKPLAYFRTILKETLGECRLRDLERQTRLPRGFIPGPQASAAERRRDRQGDRPKPERFSSVLEETMKRLRLNGAAPTVLEAR